MKNHGGETGLSSPGSATCRPDHRRRAAGALRGPQPGQNCSGHISVQPFQTQCSVSLGKDRKPAGVPRIPTEVAN